MDLRQVRPIQVWWTELIEIYWFRERDGKTEHRVERRTCPPGIWEDLPDGADPRICEHVRPGASQ